MYFLIRRDVVILRFLATFLSPFLPLNIGVGIGEIIDEFGKALFDEIDYEKGENALKFADYVTKIIQMFLSLNWKNSFHPKRIITTSWIDGIKLRDRSLLEENNLIPSSFIKTCVLVVYSNYLNTDIFMLTHILVICLLLKENADCGNLAYVDFGMMDTITNFR